MLFQRIRNKCSVRCNKKSPFNSKEDYVINDLWQLLHFRHKVHGIWIFKSSRLYLGSVKEKRLWEDFGLWEEFFSRVRKKIRIIYKNGLRCETIWKISRRVTTHVDSSHNAYGIIWIKWLFYKYWVCSICLFC